MSLYPAASFLKSDPSTVSRMGPAGYCSPLFIAHKDITKLLDHPNTIQEIINGTSTGGTTDTDTQYCVRLRVPQFARSVCLYWYAQVLLSASTGYVDTVTLTMANTSQVRLNIYGRFPDASSEVSYSAVDASLSNAVALDTLGGWRTIGQILLATGTGSGLVIAAGTAGYSAAVHSPVMEVSSTRRVVIGNMSDGRVALAEVQTPYSRRVDLGTAAALGSDSNFGFPLMGATEIIVAPVTASGTPNPSVAATGTSISSVDFVAVAASFHA